MVLINFEHKTLFKPTYVGRGHKYQKLRRRKATVLYLRLLA